MGLMDILNQAADVLNQINATAQNGNSFTGQGSAGSTIGGALARWGASVINKYADTSQQIAFTKYINSTISSGSDRDKTRD